MRREDVDIEGLPSGHYSGAVRVGDLVFTSGVVATDKKGTLIGQGDILIQAQTVFHNLGRLLEACGSQVSDIVKLNIFVTDVEARSLVDDVRRKFLSNTRPATTMIEVSALGIPGTMIEVEAIAINGKIDARRDVNGHGE